MADALRRWYRAHVTARPSTLVLSAVFIAVVLLYFAVRPDSTATGGSQPAPSHRATPTAPATGSAPPTTSRAPSTTPPTSPTTTAPTTPTAPSTSLSVTPTATHARSPSPSPTVSPTR